MAKNHHPNLAIIGRHTLGRCAKCSLLCAGSAAGTTSGSCKKKLNSFGSSFQSSHVASLRRDAAPSALLYGAPSKIWASFPNTLAHSWLTGFRGSTGMVIGQHQHRLEGLVSWIAHAFLANPKDVPIMARAVTSSELGLILGTSRHSVFC